MIRRGQQRPDRSGHSQGRRGRRAASDINNDTTTTTTNISNIIIFISIHTNIHMSLNTNVEYYY